MSSDEISAIGDRDTITGLKMAGVQRCTIPKSPQETRNALHEYFRDPSIGLILITEPLTTEVEDTIMELSEAPVPVILLIPDRSGATGAYEAMLKELIRKAIGIEIKL
ncbi:MAG: V-type ATP synthase subunit F [Candidatus Thorarchaeota archaeon]|jgi:V/A-type H+/Na+-transporting ATPase subunit F|nr:V-type ATP synthase subunit F [Candidatus Thorarchaeota archaeon]